MGLKCRISLPDQGPRQVKTSESGSLVIPCDSVDFVLGRHLLCSRLSLQAEGRTLYPPVYASTANCQTKAKQDPEGKHPLTRKTQRGTSENIPHLREALPRSG